MTPQETIDNNILLAEFIGYEFNLENQTYKIPNNEMCFVYDTLLFHVDLNQLVLVLQAIGDKTEYELVSCYNYSYWNRYGENPFSGPGDPAFGGYSDIINIYEACVAFVKWYNQNQGGN